MAPGVVCGFDKSNPYRLTPKEDYLNAFACWSGGKESTFACYKTMRGGVEISYLVNMISEDGLYSRSHGVSSEVIRLQAQAIGIPLIQQRTSWESYERNFKEVISNLKQKGVEAGVFGDIDLLGHRDWAEKVSGEMQIKPILPLWGKERAQLVKDFLQAGFEAVVISVNTKFLQEDWLGRTLDGKFLEEMQQLENVDLCGEKGEYHTLVINGPLFKRPFRVKTGKKIPQKERVILEIEGV